MNWTLALSLFISIVLIAWMAEPAPVDSIQALARSAEEAFRLHSYRQAIRDAEGCLKQSPDRALAGRMKRIVGLSKIALGQVAPGIKVLSQLLEEQKEYATDAEILVGIAQAKIRNGQLRPAAVVADVDRAVVALALEKNTAKQIELLFQFAVYAAQRMGDYDVRRESDYRIRMVMSADKVLEIYDRILALGGSAGDQVRALAGKSSALVQVARQIESLLNEKKTLGVGTRVDLTRPWDLAIEYEREIVRRFPDRASAPAALIRIAQLLEGHRQDYLGAIKVYQEVIDRYPSSPEARTARAQILAIRAPQLSIQVEGVSLPGKQPTFRWASRNLARIDLVAYPVDLFDCLRKVGDFSQLHRLPLPAAAPAAQWTIRTGDIADYHQRFSSDPVQAPLSESGAYLVNGSGTTREGKSIEVRFLLLVSRLAVVAKGDGDRTIAFVTDALTGEPRPGTRLLSQMFVRTETVPNTKESRSVYAYQELDVPDHGLVEIPKRTVETRMENSLLMARQGKDYALTDSHGYWYAWSYHTGRKVFAYTDRPVYRPKQTVEFKLIARHYKDGQFHADGGAQAKVLIRDPRGTTVYEKELTANDYGTLSGSMILPEQPPLGMYHIEVAFTDGQPSEMGPGVAFRVEEYKKPEYEVTIVPEKATYKVGQSVRAKIHGEYYFGGAVAGAEVRFTVHRQPRWHLFPWMGRFDWLYDGDLDEMSEPTTFGKRGVGRFRPYPAWRNDLVHQGTVQTDEHGDATIEFATSAFDQTPTEDLTYRIDVHMVDQSRREIDASQTISVTHQAFSISLRAERGLYQPGDKARVSVRAQNPDGRPVSFQGKVKTARVTQRESRDQSGKITVPEQLEPISDRSLAANARGEAEVEFSATEAGYYKVTAEAPDPYGGTITGSTYVWVAKASGELAHYAFGDLEMVLDKDTYRAGDQARLLLVSKHAKAYVLVTVEADKLYYQKVHYLPEKSLAIELPIEASFRPNAWISATLLRDNKIHQENRAIRVPPVESFLNVTLRAPKKEFRPRESAEVEVVVTDHQGSPVQTELSLGVVDASLFYIQEETRGDIRKFFYGATRPRNVHTTSSFAFRGWYEGHDRRDVLAAPAAPMGAGGGIMPGLAARQRANESAPMALMADEKVGRAKEAGAAKKADFAAPEIRSEFPDTVFWAASLVTGTDGKAKTTIRFPDSLTTWRLTAVAADSAAAFGEVKEEVRTKKNILVRLESPRFLVERDEVTLSAIAHNYFDQPKTIRVRLECSPELAFVATSGAAEPSAAAAREVDVTVPAGGEKRVDFRAKARRAGSVRLSAQALADAESDAMVMALPVLEYGAQQLLVQSGVLIGASEGENRAVAKLHIPAEIRPGSQQLRIEVSPSVAGVMLSSLPYLLEYPYGCTEQTMSRFLPAALTAATLKKLGLDLAEIARLVPADPATAKRLEQFRKSPVVDQATMQAMIDAGLKRLASFQHPDGGWGWWKDDASNPYLSAYVVSGLATARDAGIRVPDQMVDRATAFLIARATQAEPLHRFPWQQEEDRSVRVYLLYAIGKVAPSNLKQPELHRRLRQAFEGRDDLHDYSRALLALALHTAGLREEAEITLANIKDRARVDENGTASWGDYDGYYYWYQCGTEATSFSLKALLAIEPSSPMVQKVVNWLLRHRRGTQWFSTKDTAIACEALAGYLELSGELHPDVTFTIEAGGVTRVVRVTRDNLFTANNEMVLAADSLGTGEKTVTIRRSGQGNAYWSCALTYFNRQEQIPAAGHEIFVERAYTRLIPKVVEKKRKVFDAKRRGQATETYREIEYTREPLADGATLNTGDRIEVALEIVAKNNFEYLCFEDPKPAGCEAVELRSGSDWAGGMGSYREMRDTKVAFFSTYLNQGKHRLGYELRAEAPGVFHALPAHAECMYAPLVKGNSTNQTIRVVDRSARPK